MISIHALREEGDCTRQMVDSELVEFLSTPSARRATQPHLFLSTFFPISIHALREEGDDVVGQIAGVLPISIHALREEGDKRELHPRRTSRNFYPRPPRGGRPINHAILKAKFNFYPRPPRGGRHTSVPSLSQAWIFLSTPSARRATGDASGVQRAPVISIHALREEGDPRW